MVEEPSGRELPGAPNAALSSEPSEEQGVSETPLADLALEVSGRQMSAAQRKKLEAWLRKRGLQSL